MTGKWGDAPPEWRWGVLEEFADVALGKTPRKADYTSTGVKILKFRDIREVGIDWENADRGFVPEAIVTEKRLREVLPGTTLITASAHSPEQIGRKVAFLRELPADLPKVVYAGELCAVKTKDEGEMLAAWPFVFFRSELGYRVIQDAVRGGHLTGGRAKNMEILLPPPPIQEQIVGWMEEIQQLQESNSRQQQLLAQTERSITSGYFAGTLGNSTD